MYSEMHISAKTHLHTHDVRKKLSSTEYNDMSITKFRDDTTWTFSTMAVVHV